MTCSHCGDRTLTMEYTLRFRLDEETRELELTLCTDCFGELSADPDIEADRDVAGTASERQPPE